MGGIEIAQYSPKSPTANSFTPPPALADITRMIGKTAQIDLLARLLQAGGLRHLVISQNIANVNTPNYRRLDVTFESEVERQLAMGDDAVHLRPRVVETDDGPDRLDGNGVDIDNEVALLNRNTLMTAAATQVLAMKIAQLRSAIAGR